MRQAPPLAHLPRYPIVGGVSVLALLVSLAYWSKVVDVSPLMEDDGIRRGEVWRLATSALPHGDPIHLAFNLLWLWVLGTLVEDRFGHVRTLLLVLLLAIGSASAEYAFLYGGIGLSGVGYGLFGFLWVLSRRDDAFRDAVDAQTVQMFVGWFFMCIVLTVADVWKVANLAHAAGAILGGLVGLAASGRRGFRVLHAAGLSVLLIGLGAAVYARPYVNLSADRARALSVLGYEAMEEDRYEDAVRHYRAAIAAAKGEPDAAWWFNLGLAYQKLDDYAAAKNAYGRAAELDPSDKVARELVGSMDPLMKLQRAHDAIKRDQARREADDPQPAAGDGATTQPVGQ